jgi:MFS transporter, ACS family, phthalate transporter
MDTQAPAASAQVITRAELLDAAYRKSAWRLMPFLFLCYVLNYIDRSNVSFARLQLGEMLGFSDAIYGLGVSCFFVGYVLFEIPSNLLMQRIGVRKTLTRIMLLWGLVSAAMMFIRTPMHFYIARFALGVAEAGFLPGVIYYLTCWFPAAWRGRITARLLVAIPISGILSGIVSGAIMRHMDGVRGLPAWQWLFLLEGLPTVFAGVFAWFHLVDHPREARWLSETQRALIVEDLQAQQHAMLANPHASVGFAAALRNPHVYLAGFAYFCVMWASSLLNFWGPSIIRRSGVADALHIGLLSTAPYALGALAMLWMCWHSDRRLERRWHFAGSMLVAGAGAAALAAAQHHWVLSMVFLTVLALGYLSATALFWTIPPCFLSGPGAAGGIALIGSIAQLGAIIAPLVFGWTSARWNSMTFGLCIVACVACAGALVVLLGIPRGVFDNARARHQ